MTPIVRPLSVDDADELLPLDQEYARLTGDEELIDAGSVSFYSRSGHAFVLVAGGRLEGFLLGQAIWNGRRPTVLVRRVNAHDPASRRALLEAVTKSAYDAGVYDLLVELPDADGEAVPALTAAGYRLRETRLYSRVLGSRSLTEER